MGVRKVTAREREATSHRNSEAKLGFCVLGNTLKFLLRKKVFFKHGRVLNRKLARGDLN